MPTISTAEKLRRHKSNQSVIGTSAMEGIVLDRETLELMRRFEEGELDRAALSAAIQAHVQRLLARAGNQKAPEATYAGAA
jgi:hypothetical protein